MISKLVIFAFVILTVLAIAAGQSNMQAMNAAQGALNFPVGKPQFHLNGGGSGSNARNWGAGGNVGAGMKVWQSQNQRHSVGAGVSYGQSFGRSQGLSFRSRPDIGAGVGYRYRFGK